MLCDLIVVNRMHPRVEESGIRRGSTVGPLSVDGRSLLTWLGERDARGFERLLSLVNDEQPVVALPLLPAAPADLSSLGALSERFSECLAESRAAPVSRR